jgi:hypothetical protein
VALTGRRFEGDCTQPDDCNDGDGATFRNASVRSDFDNDQYCSGLSQTMCIGSSPPANYRLSTTCQGNDCRDTNAQATTTCNLVGAYTTSYRTSTCPSGPVTNTLTVLNSCPPGFFLFGAVRTEITAGGGQCTPFSNVQITQTCNFLEGTTCRIVGDCIAL